ncbi:MAG: VanZ family protein [Bacillales bacterium]|nr:VanZ family protein [Bacillales bacterium]
MKKGLLFKKMFKWLCLAAYILSAGVLIFESCLNGDKSSNQSNAVGGSIMDIVNDLNGDTSKNILPKLLSIDNKINEAYVGDVYTINAHIEPEESKYQAINFSSSNTSVASINNNGEIHFLSKGQVTITAFNDTYTDVKDEFSIDVKEVLATSFTSKIDNCEVDEEGIYSLYIGETYSVTNIFVPTNTTNKNVTYSLDNTSYLSITSSGLITPLKISQNEVTTLTVSTNGFTNQLKIKVKNNMENFVALKSLSINDISICVSESKIPVVIVEPSNATNSTYTIVSNDQTIARINGKNVVGIKEGTTTLTVTSNDNPLISSTCTITVKSKPEPSNITVTSSILLVEGGKKKITVSVTPYYANKNNITYTSLDTSIATVDSSGYVNGINEGSTTIEVRCGSIVKNVNITVTPPKEPIVITDYTLNKTTIPSIECSRNYDLSSLIYVTEWIPSKPDSTKLTYSLYNPQLGSINGTNLIITKPCTSIIIIVDYQGIQKEVIIQYAYEPIKITKDDVEVSSIDVNPYEEFDLIINNHELQDLTFTSDNYNLSITKTDESTYHIYVKDEGTTVLTFTPLINNYTIPSGYKKVTITSKHIKVDYLKVEIYKQEDNSLIQEITDNYNLYANEKLYLDYTINSNATISEITYKVDNESILTIDNKGNIIPKKAGVTKVIIQDKYSNISKEFTLNVYNVIRFVQDGSYSVSGHNVKNNDDGFILTNGYSYKLQMNFTKDTTYKVVNYSLSDEDVISISEGGTITPISKGNATIHVVIDDGKLEPIKFDIEIEVIGKPAIENVSEFLHKVRKQIGHFGAFLVFGIFSTLTYILFFINKKKLWAITLPFNIAQGFGLAYLTEFIQKFVPGRYGCLSDVLLDFYGFLISAVTISVATIAFYLIKYFINKKKKS